MGLVRSLAVGALMAGVTAGYCVRRRHMQTQEGYLTILKQLPSDAQRWATTTRRRAELALEEGKSAARSRERELTARLEAVRPAGGTFS